MIKKSTQSAVPADGSTPLVVTGEVHITRLWNSHSLVLEALVVDGVEAEVLAGTPFMAMNNIGVRPTMSKITIGDDTIMYGELPRNSQHHPVWHTLVEVLHAPITDMIWPGDFVELDLPSTYIQMTA